jgi:hypothetical protein
VVVVEVVPLPPECTERGVDVSQSRAALVESVIVVELVHLPSELARSIVDINQSRAAFTGFGVLVVDTA